VPVEEEPEHEMLYVFSEAGAAYKRVDISGNFKAYKSFEREYEFDKNRHGGNNRTHKAVGSDGSTRCALSVVPVEEEPDHEMLYVFSEAGAAYKRVDISGGTPYAAAANSHKHKDGQYIKPSSGGIQSKGQPDGNRCALSIIDIKSASGRGKHPTEKPMDLYKWLIERYVPEGGTVLDPTFGSGNCVFQAHAMGRHAIGMEMDKGFYDKAVARLAEQTPPQNVITEAVPANIIQEELLKALPPKRGRKKKVV